MGGDDGRKAAERIAVALNARKVRYDKGDVIDSYYEYVSPEDVILRELRESDLRAVLAHSTELEAECARMREELAAARNDIPACCSAVEMVEHDEDCETRSNGGAS